MIQKKKFEKGQEKRMEQIEKQRITDEKEKKEKAPKTPENIIP
jgi:hypothetical protein